MITGLRRCLDGLDADEIYDICRSGSEPELNDRLRHAVNKVVRADGGLCEREGSHGPLRRVDLRLVDTTVGRNGFTVALIESKMRYGVDVAFANDWVVNGRNGLAGDLAKLAKAGANVPTYLLLWSPYIERARRPLKYPRWTRRIEDGQVPDISLADCRAATNDMLALLSAGPRWHVEVYTGRRQDADFTLDAWLLETTHVRELAAQVCPTATA